ncbi:MAG: PASTA domain-containing protein [Thermodesulfobacteria bacterium]|nr:PASTA domain-containing protein [Thermodesulfobacteriota bacterium]
MKRVAVLALLLGVIFLLTRGVSGLLNRAEPPKKATGYQEHHLGEIYDVEGRLLAESVPVKGLTILPQAFQPEEEALLLLSKATGKPPSALTVFLSEGKDFLYLPPGLSDEVISRLERLEGVFVRRYFERRYPFSEFRPLMGRSDSGLIGVEAYYRRLLSRPETNLRLAVKLESEEALRADVKRAMRLLRAEAGGGIILDLRSGRVKAIVSEGGLDLLSSDISLAALEEPFEEAYEDSMFENEGDFLRALGFGEPTGIDLPGEDVGVLPLEVSSFEDVLVSPIQLVRALAAIATGKLHSPKLVLEVQSGEEHYQLATTQEEIDDLVPREKGGAWWWGGSRKAGAFLLAGLYPRQKPTLAYLLYVKGVKVWGLPCYYTRFIPKSLRLAKTRTLARAHKKPEASAGKAAVMPDVRGLTLKEALEHLAPLGLKVSFSGFGVTVRQWPAPGASLKKVKECYLVLK